LALYDYKDRDGKTEWNTVLSYLGYIFAVIFIFEALLKVLAKGFILHKNAYLRDSWNVLDFIIAVTRYSLFYALTFLIFSLIDLLSFLAPANSMKINIKAFRNLRVLRPLKSLNAVPSMKRLVSTLI
jgi:voltage-dependent calcium channel L type alpha-1D